MSAESTLILTGILVLLTPFLGLPSAWYAYIFAILGIVVVSIGVMFRSRQVAARAARTEHMAGAVASPYSAEPAHQGMPPQEPSPIA